MEAASAALSLVDVALRLGKYISETLEYSKERAAFQLELSQLAALLRRFAQHKHSGSPDDALVIELRGIQNNVEKLHKKLFAEVGLGKVHRQLRWPFVKKEILEITGRIERAKTFLILILSNDIGQEIKVERTRAQSRHADITKQLTDLTVNTTRARAVAESLKVQSFPSVSPKDVMLLQTEQAEARRARIAEQISAFDQRENHARVLSQVQTEAGLWFIQQLDGWMEHSSQIVWATGIPGGGKTSLTAVAIEHIKKRKKAAETFVGYIYLKFSVKMSLQDIFASLERQTVEQGASISQTQALGHSNARSLSGRLGSFTRSYIIVDALDEYPDGVGRLELVDDLTELVVNNGVNLLLTSRPVIAKDRFDERIQWMEIRAHDEDLVPYIERQLSGARLKRLLKGNETLREEIKGVLLRQNEGMFLLPRLHLDLLSRCRSLAELRRTLQKLPDSVFDTVQQSLQRIREQDPGDAHLAELVLAWTVFSRRHLTLSELQSAVAACDIHSTTWSELQEAITDEGLLVDVCLGLVDVQEAHGIKEPLVSMTHFTIQQFFDMFGLEQFPWAHVQITNACLRHMTLHPLFNDLGSFNVDFDPEASFSHYAAVEWGHHGRAVEDDPTFLDSVVSFSYRETCVAKAGQILLEHDRSSLLAYPEAAPSTSLAVSGITPLHLTVYFNCLSLLIYQLSTSSAKLWIDAPDHQSRTPLWYAARLGLTDIVTTLLEHEASPNIAEKTTGFTALDVALTYGHSAVAVSLLEHLGTVVSSLDARGINPLSHAVRLDDALLLMSLFDSLEVDPGLNGSEAYRPFTQAVLRGNTDIISCFLEMSEIDVNAPDGSISNLFVLALSRQRPDIAALLSENGADFARAFEVLVEEQTVEDVGIEILQFALGVLDHGRVLSLLHRPLGRTRENVVDFSQKHKYTRLSEVMAHSDLLTMPFDPPLCLDCGESVQRCSCPVIEPILKGRSPKFKQGSTEDIKPDRSPSVSSARDSPRPSSDHTITSLAASEVSLEESELMSAGSRVSTRPLRTPSPASGIALSFSDTDSVEELEEAESSTHPPPGVDDLTHTFLPSSVPSPSPSSTAVGTKKVFSYDPSLNATLSHIEQLLHDISLSVGLTDLLVQDRHWSDDVLKEICPVGENEGRTMVTKVQDKRTNRILARKALSVFHPWAPGSQLLQDLTRISSIQHINIIQFVGGYVSPTSHHIVLLLDFSEGGSLESIAKQLSVKGMAIAESIVGRIAEGVLHGLDWLCSQHNTLHGNIKPSNILLSRDGIAKLSEMNLSMELVGGVVIDPVKESGYMAPECFAGANKSIQADIWSTGISLLEFVLREYPYPASESIFELIMHIVQTKPPDLRDVGDTSWSTNMKNFFGRSLSTDASVRPLPRDLLAHPWIRQTMDEDVQMSQWIAEVWDWPNLHKQTTVRHPPGACIRCKALKMKCVYEPESLVCIRCQIANMDCIIEGRKPRSRPRPLSGGTSTSSASQHQIDEAVSILRENITKVAERGERLDSLQGRTNLAVSAQSFRRGTNRRRETSWWSFPQSMLDTTRHWAQQMTLSPNNPSSGRKVTGEPSASAFTPYPEHMEVISGSLMMTPSSPDGGGEIPDNSSYNQPIMRPPRKKKRRRGGGGAKRRLPGDTDHDPNARANKFMEERLAHLEKVKVAEWDL